MGIGGRHVVDRRASAVRAVVQRVSEASVSIEGLPPRRIGRGLMVLLGIEAADTADDIAWLVGKLPKLRIFPDEGGQMNLSLADIGGEVLLVSQFTLFASTAKGTRPSFNAAARPDVARPLYEAFIRELESALGRSVATGEFGAAMDVSLVNAGPVTLLLDSKRRE